MKIVRWIDENFEKVFLVILSVLMVFLIFLQVFMRYVMQNSLSWTEELARYSFIWLIYIGISFAVKEQRHIKIDVVLLLFKERGKLIFGIIANLLFLAFAIAVVIYGYNISQQLLAFGQKSPANQIPMGLVYLATPVGMGLTAIRLIQQLIKEFKTLMGKGDFHVKTEFDRIREE